MWDLDLQLLAMQFAFTSKETEELRLLVRSPTVNKEVNSYSRTLAVPPDSLPIAFPFLTWV